MSPGPNGSHGTNGGFETDGLISGRKTSRWIFPLANPCKPAASPALWPFALLTSPHPAPPCFPAPGLHYTQLIFCKFPTLSV